MKIYIAGPMSGLVEFNRPAFMFTAAKLTGRGHTALTSREFFLMGFTG